MSKRIITSILVGIVGASNGTNAIADTLENVVFKTLASNPDILSEFENRNAVEQQLRQAKSGYYPSVDLMAAIGEENSKNRYTRAVTGTDDYVDLTRSEEAIIVTQNIFSGFDTSNEVERYAAKLKATNHRLHDESESIALKVADVYLSVLRNMELVKISEQNLDIHQEIMQKVRSRNESGVGRRSDLEQAKGRLALARANLVADRTSLMNAKSRYIAVTGGAPSNLVRPDDKDNVIPGKMQEALALAIDNNPVLKAANEEVEAAKAQRDGSRSGYYPKLDLVFEQSRFENVDGLETVEKDYSLMLKMRYNLFNGGYDSSRSKEAAYRLNESKNDLASTRRQVVESMQIAWNMYDSVREQIPYLKEHQDSSVRTRQAYERQFGIGQRTLLDLLDSENEVYRATRAMINAEYEKQYNGYLILATMGRFIDELKPSQKNQ